MEALAAASISRRLRVEAGATQRMVAQSECRASSGGSERTTGLSSVSSEGVTDHSFWKLAFNE